MSSLCHRHCGLIIKIHSIIFQLFLHLAGSIFWYLKSPTIPTDKDVIWKFFDSALRKRKDSLRDFKVTAKGHTKRELSVHLRIYFRSLVIFRPNFPSTPPCPHLLFMKYEKGQMPSNDPYESFSYVL